MAREEQGVVDAADAIHRVKDVTMYSYFEHIWSGSSLYGTHLLPLPPPHSPHRHTPGDDDDILDTNDDKYL